MQYFASFEPFEIFEEFNGVPGTYIKSFLISDKINLNKWQATHEANIANLDSFLGRPGIHYINEEGKRDHTSATSFEKSLQLQELYRAASIIAVGSDIPSKKNWQMSKMVDDGVTAKIKSKEIKWISPSIWPKENAVEVIEQTDGESVDVVHDYDGLHYAFVDEPAYSDEAEIKAFCDGTTKQCQTELAKFNASIDNVGPITDKKIILPKQNSSKQPVNTSHKINSTFEKTMATQEETLKELEETKKSLKATEEELEKIKKDEAARKATEEEDEKKNSEGKKAEDEKEDDEEKTALKARIETLEKVPVVEKIVASQLSAGIITKEKVSDLTNQLMASSKSQLDAVLTTAKSFEAKLKSVAPSDDNTSIPYMGSVNDSDYGSFDASIDDMDFDKLMEVRTN